MGVAREQRRRAGLEGEPEEVRAAPPVPPAAYALAMDRVARAVEGRERRLPRVARASRKETWGGETPRRKRPAPTRRVRRARSLRRSVRSSACDLRRVARASAGEPKARAGARMVTMAPPMTSLFEAISRSWALLLVARVRVLAGRAARAVVTKSLCASRGGRRPVPRRSAHGRGCARARGFRGAPAAAPTFRPRRSGSPGEGVFRQPEAIAVAPSGSVYVGDQFSHLVQVFSPTGAFVGQWGSAGAARASSEPLEGSRPTRRATSTSSTPRTTASRSTPRVVASSAPGAAAAAAWGEFDFGAGDGPGQAARRGHRRRRLLRIRRGYA